jgi:lantibiotic leader peptide-processing serine protease
MSFFTDPWLYNCTNNPADTPAQQQEQTTIREATQRALDFARSNGVLPIAALGNEATDIGHPTVDTTSPDFPSGAAKTRTVDNSCITVPTESNGVTSVSALGPSGRKSFYSNWGVEQTDVSAPGGDSREGFGTNRFNLPENRVLSTFPLNVAIADGRLNPDGTPNTPLVLRDCKDGTCAYYQHLQGTSMPTAAQVVRSRAEASGSWWAPRSSKPLRWASPAWRVRFPSASATSPFARSSRSADRKTLAFWHGLWHGSGVSGRPSEAST